MDADQLARADATSGATAWEFGGWDGVTSFPLVAGEHVYITGRRGDLYALDRSSGAVAWCMRTDTKNYGGDPHTLAVGAGLMLLAVGGELVALESGGTPGCRFYETALPRYADPIDDLKTSRTAEAAGGFVPNRGRLSGSVLFASDAGEQSLLVDASGPTLTMPGGEVTLRLRGGGPAESVRPEQRLPGVVNDYTGPDRSGWRTGLPRYGRVRLRGVAEGVDLVVRDGREGRFAYDLVLAPGHGPGAAGAGVPRRRDAGAGPGRQPAAEDAGRHAAAAAAGRVPARAGTARRGARAVPAAGGRRDRVRGRGLRSLAHAGDRSDARVGDLSRRRRRRRDQRDRVRPRRQRVRRGAHALARPDAGRVRRAQRHLRGLPALLRRVRGQVRA